MSDRTEYVLKELGRGYYDTRPEDAIRDLEIICQEARMTTDPLSPTPLSEIVTEGRELLAEAMEMGWPKAMPTTEALHKFLRRHAVVLLDALDRLSPGVAEPPHVTHIFKAGALYGWGCSCGKSDGTHETRALAVQGADWHTNLPCSR